MSATINDLVVTGDEHAAVDYTGARAMFSLQASSCPGLGAR